MFNPVKEVAKKPGVWLPYVGFISFPAAAAMALIAIASLLAANKAVKAPKSTAGEPLTPTVNAVDLTASSGVEDEDEDALKQEMIRLAMSELGKRSAEARSKKRQAKEGDDGQS
jgi:hypothetical protein